ncbi:MAG: hypothetical protein H8E21_01005 [Gammaproteobacteria bacterium]|nr:hypothetical protein [Gammaproteobacteria bacterium]
MNFQSAILPAIIINLATIPLYSAFADDRPYTLNIGFLVFSELANNDSEDFPGASYSMPFSLSIRQDELRWKISSSHLTQVDSDATYNGFGDTSIGVSYDMNDWLSLSYKHKFATGDESDGFSSGEDDDSVKVDTFHSLTKRTSLFTTVGYKWVGKGDRDDRQNAASAAIGIGYAFKPDFSLMGSLDYYESSYTTSSDTTSFTVLGSHKITSQTRIGWFVGTDSDDVFSAGTSIGYSF